MIVGVSDQTAELQDKIDMLEQALISNRRIGVALGLLMRLNDWTHDEAWNAVLRQSQCSNIKVATLAAQIIDRQHASTEFKRRARVQSGSRRHRGEPSLGEAGWPPHADRQQPAQGPVAKLSASVGV